MLVDSMLVVLVFYSSLYIRLGEVEIIYKDNNYLFLFLPIFALPVFKKIGLYKEVLRYIDLSSLKKFAIAVSLYSLFIIPYALLIEFREMPRSLPFINWMLLMISSVGIRIIGQLFLIRSSSIDSNQKNKKNILIYGAGSAGIQLAKSIRYSPVLNPIGFIDDDRNLANTRILGLSVNHSESISDILLRHNISEILLAMPSIDILSKRNIIEKLAIHKIIVRSVPSFNDLIEGKLKIDQLRTVSIVDLLGREVVPPIKQLLEKNILNKVVLVSGAGGSIGSEISRQISTLKPLKLILLDNSEFSLYRINNELQDKFPEISIYPVICNVLDEDRISVLLEKFRVNTIYHAAAYKHVPLVEHNIFPALENNILGTLTLAELAVLNNIESFVLVSTDKAVRPTNFMGASKRLSEIVLQVMARNKKVKTIFSMVRFGNVLDSSGSVIPLFNKQIKKGGPITLTSMKITRYFMTIPEAAQLVIQAGAMAKGGDVFILDMGKPIKIYDLAKKMIKLNGFSERTNENPKGDIEIKIVGLRPGEKLYEELLISDNAIETNHKKIFRSFESSPSSKELKIFIRDLKDAIKSNNFETLLSCLSKMIPEFKIPKKIRDYLKEWEFFNEGEGFIGSDVCQKLLDNDLDVVISDNLINNSYWVINNISRIAKKTWS